MRHLWPAPVSMQRAGILSYPSLKAPEINGLSDGRMQEQLDMMEELRQEIIDIAHTDLDH